MEHFTALPTKAASEGSSTGRRWRWPGAMLHTSSRGTRPARTQARRRAARELSLGVLELEKKVAEDYAKFYSHREGPYWAVNGQAGWLS